MRQRIRRHQSPRDVARVPLQCVLASRRPSARNIEFHLSSGMTRIILLFRAQPSGSVGKSYGLRYSIAQAADHCSSHGPMEWALVFALGVAVHYVAPVPISRFVLIRFL